MSIYMYLYHGNPYSDLWTSDLYFRPPLFSVWQDLSKDYLS